MSQKFFLHSVVFAAVFVSALLFAQPENVILGLIGGEPANSEVAQVDTVSYTRSDTSYSVVYLTSSICRWCLDKNHINDIESMLPLLKQNSNINKIRTEVIAVGIDVDTNRAINHINGIGKFDEISVGRNWYNTALDIYVWNSISVEPVVPQIVVLRVVHEDRNDRIERKREVVLQLQGGQQIADWVDEGALFG